MAEQLVRIVTDGAVELSSETVQALGIGIVPRQLKRGRTTYESNEQTALADLDRQISSSRADILSPTINAFLQAYRRFESVPVVSIHPAETLDDAAHFARLARNLMTAHPLTTYYDAQGNLQHLQLPQPVPDPPRISVFEAKTIDLGLRLLVTVAAQAARDSNVAGQINLLLHRLQDEMLQTFVIARDTSYLSVVDSPDTSFFSTVGGLLPGGETLLRLERSTGQFQILDRGRNMAQALVKHPELGQIVPQPCEIWIRHRGHDKKVQELAGQLKTVCQAERVSVEDDSLAALPYFPSRYIELIFGPTPETIERVVRFTRRVWGTYELSDMPSGTY